MSGSNSINLPYYPATNRTPGTFADADGSKANTATTQDRTLLLGQMLATGTAPPNVPQLFTSLAAAGLLFGIGSMIYQMLEQYEQTDTFGEVWAVGLPDPSGTKATGTITLTAGTLGTGTLNQYIGGYAYPTTVLAGDTVTTIAARLVALITVNPDSPVTATASAGVVTLTAKHVGLLGNDIDIRTNYLGALGGESSVSGLTVTSVAMNGGTGVPSLTTAIANLGDVTYDYVGLPYADTASLNAIDAFFNFSVGRWSWQQMLYGGAFTAQRGTPGSLVTFGQARNGPNVSVLGFYDSPDPSWVVAADYTATCAVSLRADPNRPLQEIVMSWAAPPRTSGFTRSIRNALLYDGISTYKINRAGQVVLERACTTYQLNTAGLPDNSYLDVETLYGTAFLIRSWQAEMTRLFPRYKLFQDGNAIPAGSDATTAHQIKIATIAWYRAQCALGNAQNPDEFAAAVLAQNAGNGLVKELLPFMLPQQLRQIAGDVQFTKP